MQTAVDIRSQLARMETEAERVQFMRSLAIDTFCTVNSHIEREEGCHKSWDQMQRNYMEALDGFKDTIANFDATLKTILAAFPSAEAGGLLHHRMFHEQEATRSEDHHVLMQSVTGKVVGWLVIAVIILGGVSVWEHILLAAK